MDRGRQPDGIAKVNLQDMREVILNELKYELEDSLEKQIADIMGYWNEG